MPSQVCGRYLGRVHEAETVPDLHLLAAEIADAWPLDEATPRLLGVIGAKAAHLASLD